MSEVFHPYYDGIGGRTRFDAIGNPINFDALGNRVNYFEPVKDHELCPVPTRFSFVAARWPSKMHCSCWFEGNGCCRCKAPAMTAEQREAQGME